MNRSATTRPPLLSALCILTFLGSGISFFGYFIVSVYFEKFSELIIRYSSWSSTDAISPMFFTSLMALYAISLTGAIRMWKLHRDGLLLYIFSQIIILFLPSVWTDFNSFSSVNAIFTVIFITGYTIDLKHLKK